MATVKVRVHEARNLPIMDSTTGLADPYAVVKIDDAEQFTAIAHKTLNPQWDCAFTFDLSDFLTLQEDPVEVRVYDHDIISRDDLIGLVFVDLNSVLTTMSNPTISQWFPLSDSINGPRGELRLSVRVKFHSPENPFNPVLPTRLVMPPLSFLEDTLSKLAEASVEHYGDGINSYGVLGVPSHAGYREEVYAAYRAEAAKCLRDTNTPLAIAKADKKLLSSVVEGVFLFPMSRLDPTVFRVERIADMVEELFIKSDPEQTLRFGSFQSTRQLNEARQIQLFKLSGQVRRQLTQKVLGMQCNAVLGYVEEFDIEARTILVRAYGTPAVVSKVELKPIALPAWGGKQQDAITTTTTTANVGDDHQGGEISSQSALDEGHHHHQTNSSDPPAITAPISEGIASKTTSNGGHSATPQHDGASMGSKVSTSICFADNEQSPTATGSPSKFAGSSEVGDGGIGGGALLSGTPQQRNTTNMAKERSRRKRGSKKSIRHSTRRSKAAVVSKRRGNKRGGGRGAAATKGGGAGGSGAADDGASRQEVMLISLASLPSGALVHVAGVVSAKSVKVVARVRSKKAITQERDSWWLEVRSEVRRNARSFHCNAVIGYTEETLYHDNVVVVIATGTAVVVDPSWVAFRRGPAELFYTAIRQFERNDNCAVLHCYDGTRAVRIRGEDTLVGGHVCEACGGYRVPEMLLLTCEAPSELELEGQHRLVEVVAVRAKADVQGVDLAKAVSQALPMLEYSLHLQLTWKLKFCGFNAGFNFRTRYATNSSLIIAYASVTGARIKGIPIPKAPTHHVSDEAMLHKVVPLIAHFKDRLTSLEVARRSAFAVLSTVLGMPARGIQIPMDMTVSNAMESTLAAVIPPILATTPTSGWLDFTAYRGKRVFSFPIKSITNKTSNGSSGGRDSGDSGDTNSTRSSRSRRSTTSDASTNETWGTSETSTTSDTTTGSDADSDLGGGGSGSRSTHSNSETSSSGSSKGDRSTTSSSQSYLSDMSDEDRAAGGGGGGGGGKKRRHKTIRRRANVVREYNLRIEDEDDAQMVLGSVDSMADADTALLPAAFIPHHPHDFEVSHPLFVQKCFRVPPSLPNSQRTSFISSCIASIKREAVSQLRVFAGVRTQGILSAVAEVEKAAAAGRIVADTSAFDAATFLYATLNSGMDIGAATAVSPDVESLGAVQRLMKLCNIPPDSYSLGADLLECVVLQYRQELFFPYDGDELVIMARGMIGGRFNGFLRHLMRTRGFSLASFSKPMDSSLNTSQNSSNINGLESTTFGSIRSFDPCAAQLRGLVDVEAATGISTKPKAATRSRLCHIVSKEEQREVAELESLPPANPLTDSKLLDATLVGCSTDLGDVSSPAPIPHCSSNGSVPLPPVVLGASPLQPQHQLILSANTNKGGGALPATPSILPPTQAALVKGLLDAFQHRSINLERALYVSATAPFTIPYVMTTHYAVADPKTHYETNNSDDDEEGGSAKGGGDGVMSSSINNNNNAANPMSPLTYLHNSSAMMSGSGRGRAITAEAITAAAVNSFNDSLRIGGGGGQQTSSPSLAVAMGPSTPLAITVPTFTGIGGVITTANNTGGGDEDGHVHDMSQGAIISFLRGESPPPGGGFGNDPDQQSGGDYIPHNGPAGDPEAKTGRRNSDAHSQNNNKKLGPKQLLRRLKGSSTAFLSMGTSSFGSRDGGGGVVDPNRYASTSPPNGRGGASANASESRPRVGDAHQPQSSGMSRSRGLWKDTSVAMGRQWRAISSLASVKVKGWVHNPTSTTSSKSATSPAPRHDAVPSTPISQTNGNTSTTAPFDLSSANSIVLPTYPQQQGSGGGSFVATRGVMVTSMEFVPGAALVEYLGPVSHHFIREGYVTVSPDDGGAAADGGVGSSRLTRFFESAEAEMEKVVCAFVESVGGNALLCHTVQYHEVYESEGGSSHKVFVFATMTGYAARVSIEPLRAWSDDKVPSYISSL